LPWRLVVLSLVLIVIVVVFPEVIITKFATVVVIIIIFFVFVVVIHCYVVIQGRCPALGLLARDRSLSTVVTGAAQAELPK
jgi:hypothetical protein